MNGGGRSGRELLKITLEKLSNQQPTELSIYNGRPSIAYPWIAWSRIIRYKNHDFT